MNSSDRVLALKYRPKRFEDLVGQQTVSQTLSLALDMKRLPHAYLFSGLRGSGKTSTARIMAKSMLCEQGPTSRPCETCQNCLSSNNGRHLDVIEMDAASNRGIEDIKELIEHTKYQPSSGRYKVFIIDEVHMLTTQAFNALLKTLEEPPAFVKFILATTDPLKLPATILSRTQHFRFKAIALKDIIHHLEHILNIEHISYEPKAIELIARSGHGSLRDTLTLLDQAIIYSKGHITASCVTDMLGLIDPDLMDNIFDMILKNQDILDITNKLQEYETDVIIDEMAIFLKQKLITKNTKFSSVLIDRLYRILGDSKQLLSLNSDSDFVLVLMISKMVEATKLKTIDDLISEIEKNTAGLTLSNINTATSSTTNEPQQKVQEEVYKQPLTQELLHNTMQNEPINIEPSSIEQETQPAQRKGEDTFKLASQKLAERSYDLGECFEKNFIYKDFDSTTNKLHIISIAEGECKKLLWKQFAYVRMTLEECFDAHLEIEFHKQTPLQEDNQEELKKKLISDTTLSSDNQTDFDEVSSMIEEEVLGDEVTNSGCVADMIPAQPNNPASKELQIEDILNSNFVNKAKELFDPKKIIVRSKI
ncbi:DNA polymerase III subunit gamma/tau [Arcobacter sp. FWKO B]|uniref:DNA polymerase III subunit gamma/tau n=1 Tax=Arcobacter sp. FWKO B TaxID=2593672 RepID=UPI0018A6222F|nr:DNA polymerase III subunit gamma/tau [Arcobacter sp. FWKO B]QOG11937.1 DNA polymerase III subunit gamma/tau [Arcobacter sp. FWKO B]